jgi:hypothetical protein
MLSLAVFIDGLAYAAAEFDSLEEAARHIRGLMRLYPIDQAQVEKIIEGLPEAYMAPTPIILKGGSQKITFFFYEKMPGQIFDFEFYSFFTNN